jgi:hypothetical protein
MLSTPAASLELPLSLTGLLTIQSFAGIHLLSAFASSHV